MIRFEEDRAGLAGSGNTEDKMDEKTKIKRDLSAKQRLEEVARLQKKVSADIDAGAWPFSEAFSERGASAHLCRLHELTCLTCRSREQLSSEAAQDVSSWATAIESLAKQIPDSEDN
ncbi:MAG TPA: hypothetical protein VGS00_05750, partial [Thermoanaerobaculia bacterium]|nr:hypothetical protein [Thermoanaerobaculia bacterium]